MDAKTSHVLSIAKECGLLPAQQRAAEQLECFATRIRRQALQEIVAEYEKPTATVINENDGEYLSFIQRLKRMVKSTS